MFSLRAFNPLLFPHRVGWFLRRLLMVFAVGILVLGATSENVPQKPPLQQNKTQDDGNLIVSAPVILDIPKTPAEPAGLIDVLTDLFTGLFTSPEQIRQPITTNAIGQKITNGTTRGIVTKGKYTGLDLPRFVSLKSKANLRSGPGVRYPILWMLMTIDQPLEVVAEYKNWRQVVDASGVKGWVWSPLLKSERHLLVIKDESPLYSNKDQTAPVVARLGQSIVLSVETCDMVWCKVTAIHPTKKSPAGWIRRVNTWGLYQNELFFTPKRK